MPSYNKATAFFSKLVHLWLQSSKTEEVIQLIRTVTIVSTAAATPVSIVADSEVPAGFVPFAVDFFGKVNGATAWTVLATVKIQDTNGAPVDFATIAVAALTGNAFIGRHTANVTIENAMALGTGGTSGKGLQVKGNANAGVGSNLVLTVVAYYKKA
jgi:hypothetical protein